jgi:hypothetical protein
MLATERRLFIPKILDHVAANLNNAPRSKMRSAMWHLGAAS